MIDFHDQTTETFHFW